MLVEIWIIKAILSRSQTKMRNKVLEIEMLYCCEETGRIVGVLKTYMIQNLTRISGGGNF